MARVIVRIKGGLGNQLFCYAAARRLALVNDAELLIDDVSGFVRDVQYRRTYALERFAIPARKATPRERLEPFERGRRALLKIGSRALPFGYRPYLEQEGSAFDCRLLERRVRGTLHLDGLWQSESYFADIEATLRQDLRFVSPATPAELVQAAAAPASVALHVRFFETQNSGLNLDADYYRRAVALVEDRLGEPTYLVFSDRPEQARELLELPQGRATFVGRATGRDEVDDLWLMSQCRHFITANSTFSWWGAWLSSAPHKLVVCPGSRIGSQFAATWWNFPGQIPDRWIRL